MVYLSYDGALDPLGRSQVVPVVEGLARAGVEMRLVTFEKHERWSRLEDRRSMGQRLAAAGVSWTPLHYHKRLSLAATGWDLFRALVLVAWWRARGQVDLVHARSYPPTLVAWVLRRVFGVPYLFDMRGLYADERVDAGIWPDRSRRYRAVKWLERRFLRDAGAVVTLTRASVPILRVIEEEAGGGPEPVVIPTTVDLDRFKTVEREGNARPVLAYVGSFGSWYLVEEMFDFGRVFLETISASRLLFLVNDSVEEVRKSSRSHGIPDERLKIVRVLHEDVPQSLAAATATYAFIKPAPSKVASSATKVSESFALGIPVAVNRNVGDTAAVIDIERVGVVIDPFDKTTWPGAIIELGELAKSIAVRRRCRIVAEREHSLENAVTRYRCIYDSVKPVPAAR